MQIFLLVLSTFSLSLFAAEPPILDANEMVAGLPFSVKTTAEWQGWIAQPDFPAATREYYGKMAREIFETHAKEASGDHILFTANTSRIPEREHRSLHFIFTDQSHVYLRDHAGVGMQVMPNRGLPVSGFSLSRRGVYKQRNFIVVWLPLCMLHLPNYNPMDHAKVYTWMQLAVQMNGYMDHHLTNPLPVFTVDFTGHTMAGAQEKGIASETEFMDWLRNAGLEKIDPQDREWLLTAAGGYRGTYQATTCPKDIAKQHGKADEN